MTIHHLDCASMCPLGGRLLLGSGGRLTGRMVAHCLVVESADGLILVDTGLGTGDIADPGRLGRGFLTMVRPQLSLASTALHQLRALGHRPQDVRHIVLTHLDVDHAGGLADFPDARVHVLADELRAARARATRGERDRYRPVQWAHGPRWVEHGSGGESWYGFQAVRPLAEASSDLLLVPLPGHTRGHSGVAVRDGEGWLLHCGDAYFSHTDIDPGAGRRPPGLRAFQRMVAVDDRARLHNQERLRALRREHGAEVRLICAHDPDEFDRAAG
ncbi:glyoxylase-like metal-dependent hydrolase (beta-lactamase superfamily II) [Kitasatospora sp. MAA4]|uniref:MBL fold metallo-hydrolase n=1 Tax=Kitasatospora sp. MAA4 TaxID=3035093 RepID=UPI002473A3D1|nr:MBL fold metallo-hydrolase [Kitasatospora sp. MAA4]MDH6133377.1 glyoxylase-like metal-dependent hydrolase (beta-lactamase superfamily II) [Kitasatospora sp. MAA4]